MASLSTDKDGGRRIQFFDRQDNRKAIRLGRIAIRAAESIRGFVDRLESALRTGTPIDAETLRWLGGIGDDLHGKLAKAGLCEPRQAAAAGPRLGEFVRAFIDSRRGDYKPASLIAWGQVAEALKREFGPDCRLAEVTAARAEEFRQAMLKSGLRPTTVHKRLQHARLFFSHAVRCGLADRNPFEFVRHRPGDPAERRAYVPAADVLRAIEFAPNTTWKLLLALSRFCGLRIPSEAFSLRFQDVDRERNRIVVPSPKTQHLAGRSYRVIPLFPAVRPFLEAAFFEAPDGAVFLIPEEYRKRAMGPGGWANANLRSTLGKILRRAGIEPWPRLWHSLRASCESDLARQFPLAVVAKWLGNTQAVALRHYVDVTDADFERAVNVDLAPPKNPAHIPAQQPHATVILGRETVNMADSQLRSAMTIANSGGVLHKCQVEAARIEPAS